MKFKLLILLPIVFVNLISFISACGENGCESPALNTGMGMFLLSVKILLFLLVGVLIYSLIKENERRKKEKITK